MALSTEKQIKERLKAAYDESYYQSLWNRIIAAFGDDSVNGYAPTFQRGVFPDFPPINKTNKTVGKNLRIANALQILKTKVMGKLPEPEFTNVRSNITQAVLKGFWQVRATHNDWIQEIGPAFVDGVAFGNGVLEVAPRVNPITGRQFVDIRYIPIWRCLWDPVNASMGNMTYIAFAHYLPLEEAEKMWPGKITSSNAQAVYGYDGTNENSTAQQVRIFRYYDIGIAGKAPTYACLLGDIDGTILERMEMETPGLPVGFFEYGLTPGAARPSGLIDVLAAGQESLNRLDEAEDAMASQIEINLLDPQYFDEETIQKLEMGDHDGFLFMAKSPKGGELPNIRIPAPAMSATAADRRDQVERQFRSDAGITEIDTGNNPNQTRTLGENEMVQRESAPQKAWAANQCVYMYQRLIRAVFYVAAASDDDPVQVTIDGDPIWINDESDDRFDIANFVPLDLQVVIAEEAITARDQETETRQKIQRLAALQPSVGTFTDPKWYWSEMRKVLGFEQNEGAMEPQQQMPMQGNNLNPQGAPAPAIA
jgi:hypothetical protein